MSLCPQELFVQVGHYMVVNRCVPTLSQREKEKFARLRNGDFIKKLREVSGVSAGTIETTAVIAGVHDDIWPHQAYERRLRISQEELDTVRRRAREKRRRFPAKKVA